MIPVEAKAKIVGGIIEGSGRIVDNIESSGRVLNISETRVTIYPDYRGGITFTPTQSTQIIHTSDTVVHDDIVINPIPSNYGLVEWNGSYLRIS